jgi:two-component system chemotaxis sensor kinase CheA
VTLDLPLSLALLRVVLVEARDELYAIPTASVRRILHLAEGSVDQDRPSGVIEVMGEVIPLAALTTILGVTSGGTGESGQTALVMAAPDGQFAVVVNDVREEQELVFKELRGPLRALRTVAGAALLGNGDIVPILDVQGMSVSARQALAVEGPGPPPRVPGPIRPGRILVVEDSMAVGELQKVILVAAGFEAEIARDGVEALNMLRQADWDLVMTDVDMPRMDGFVLTAQVRADAHLRDLPVIIVTSRDAAEHRRRGLEAGADAYVTKREFDQDQILTLVRDHISRRRERQIPSHSLPRLPDRRHD